MDGPLADVARRRRQMYRKRMGPCLASLKPLILAANFPTFFMCVASCLTCEWQISRGGLQWRAQNESWERGIISTGAPFFEEPLPSSIFPFAKLETERVGLFCTALTRTAQCIIASMVLFCTACPRTAAMPVPVRNRTKGAIPHWAQCACPTITKTFIYPFLPEFVSKILLVLSLTCPKIL